MIFHNSSGQTTLLEESFCCPLELTYVVSFHRNVHAIIEASAKKMTLMKATMKVDITPAVYLNEFGREHFQRE